MGHLTIVRLCLAVCVQHFTLCVGSAEPLRAESPRRRTSSARLRRSGSLNLDPDIFKTNSFSDTTAGKSASHTCDTFLLRHLTSNALCCSVTQGTVAVQEPQRGAHIFPSLQPHYMQPLPAALLPAHPSPRRRPSHANTLPPLRRLAPFHVQHLAQQEGQQPLPAGRQPSAGRRKG